MDGIGANPKLVVILIGTNNMNYEGAAQTAEGIKSVTNEYLKRCPNAHILLLGIFPRGSNPADPIRTKIADINNRISVLNGGRVTYLDIGAQFLQPDGSISSSIMPDYLHPSAQGYQIWANAIQSVVNQYVP